MSNAVEFFNDLLARRQQRCGSHGIVARLLLHWLLLGLNGSDVRSGCDERIVDGRDCYFCACGKNITRFFAAVQGGVGGCAYCLGNVLVIIVSVVDLLS